MITITDETLKSRAQEILKEFESAGASWEGVALAIARLELSLDAIKQYGADKGVKINLGTWDGEYCASEKDITIFEPKCCDHDYESGCACCLGDCPDCKYDENVKLI